MRWSVASRVGVILACFCLSSIVLGCCWCRCKFGVRFCTRRHRAIELLLLAGADPNAPAVTVGLGCAALRLWAQSPLHAAIGRGTTAMVSRLLAAGADPNAAGSLSGPFGLLRSQSPLYVLAWA